MSSDRIHRRLVTLLLFASACADVRRGEYWDEPGDTDGDEAGEGDATSSPASDDDGTDDGTGDGDAEDGDSSGGTDALSFAADVFGLLEAGCERCHSPDGQASSTSFVLTDNVAGAYDETLPFIDLGAPASSRLLAKGAGNGHIGGVIYDERSTEYATILAWIEQGAMP
jgi:hypothetical protein